MGILKSLTIKHLLMNKRRTLVTIIGIILSTALILGVGLLFSSMYQAVLTDAIENSGDYHTSFNRIDGKILNVLNNNVTISETYYEENIGYSYLEGSENDYKPYLRLKSVSNNYFDRLKLIEGRLPQNSNELIISKHIETNGGVTFKIGDTIKLELGYRVDSEGKVPDVVNLMKNGNFYYDTEGEIINTVGFVEDERLQIVETKEFEIVGIVERPIFEERSSCGYSVFTINDGIQNDEILNAYVLFKNPNKTFENTKNLVDSLGININQAKENTNLLYYYGTSKSGNFTSTLTGMMLIVLGLLSAGCIIVIYNSFAISTMERKKQFGLLSSIGATKRQIRNSVFFEAIIVGSIGIVIGTLGAFLGIYTVLQIMNYLLEGMFEYKFYLCFNPLFIIIPLLFMFVVIVISAWLPAKRASKVTPVEAIRQNDDIKINKRKIRTSKLIRKIFGIEGEIALKNIKRNKKKYRITIISLFISIVMFISFSSFLKYAVNGSEDLVYKYDYDTEIGLYKESEKVENDVINLPYIDQYCMFRSMYARYDILGLDEKYYNKDFYEHFKENTMNEALVINLKENDYKEYINKIQGNYGEAILLNGVQFNNEKGVTINTKKFKETNDLSINLSAYSNDGKMILGGEATSTFKIDNIKITEETMFGLENFRYSTSIIIIVNNEKYEEIEKWNDENAGHSTITHIRVKATDVEKFAEEANAILKGNKEVSMYVNNVTLNYKQEKNLVLAVQILLYGFITLVTLIGVSSVFNTISTSISLRKKEFAMLRSMGLTPRGFNKILFLESLFFGIKSLIYSLPVSFLMTYLIAKSMANMITFDELLIPWNSVIISVVGVFAIVLATMMYSAGKIKKENILEAIRQENI